MPPVTFAALGDSFVEGRGDPVAGGYRGWVPQLAGRLGIGPSSHRNLGAYHATTDVVRDAQLPMALVNKPPLIGVVVGVNDLVGRYDPSRFESNLLGIFSALAGGDTIVFTANYPDIPGRLPVNEGMRDLLRGRFTEANDSMRRACRATGTLCLDLVAGGQLDDHRYWSEDGLHPSPLGHGRFAQACVELLQRYSDDVPLGASAA